MHFVQNSGAGMCHINGPTIQDEPAYSLWRQRRERVRPRGYGRGHAGDDRTQMGNDTAMTFTLYHHGSSVCAAKVRFAMAEKEMPWEGVYIDILKGEQFEPDYIKLNPKAVVPTLIHDERVILDSTVIIEYLDQLDPDSSLHPTDPVDRANARLWTKAVDEDLHPACGAMTFVCSHRHTVLKNLGEEGLKEFLASTPPLSVTSNWKNTKGCLHPLRLRPRPARMRRCGCTTPICTRWKRRCSAEMTGWWAIPSPSRTSR